MQAAKALQEHVCQLKGASAFCAAAEDDGQQLALRHSGSANRTESLAWTLAFWDIADARAVLRLVLCAAVAAIGRVLRLWM
jgi:hypothetical protein